MISPVTFQKSFLTQPIAFTLPREGGKQLPAFQSIAVNVQLDKGGAEAELLSKDVIANELKTRHSANGKTFTYEDLTSMLKNAGWPDDMLVNQYADNGLITNLKKEYGAYKEFGFEEAAEKLFVNRFANTYKGKGLNESEAKSYGLVAK